MAITAPQSSLKCSSLELVREPVHVSQLLNLDQYTTQSYIRTYTFVLLLFSEDGVVSWFDRLEMQRYLKPLVQRVSEVLQQKPRIRTSRTPPLDWALLSNRVIWAINLSIWAVLLFFRASTNSVI